MKKIIKFFNNGITALIITLGIVFVVPAIIGSTVLCIYAHDVCPLF